MIFCTRVNYFRYTFYELIFKTKNLLLTAYTHLVDYVNILFHSAGRLNGIACILFQKRTCLDEYSGVLFHSAGRLNRIVSVLYRMFTLLDEYVSILYCSVGRLNEYVSVLYCSVGRLNDSVRRLYCFDRQLYAYDFLLNPGDHRLLKSSAQQHSLTNPSRTIQCQIRLIEIEKRLLIQSAQSFQSLFNPFHLIHISQLLIICQKIHEYQLLDAMNPIAELVNRSLDRPGDHIFNLNNKYYE